MARVKNKIRDETTGAGINAVSVDIDRKNGGASVTTVTSDSDGMFDYQANGSPGDVEWTATSGGLTRIVAGDMSVQTGGLYTGELYKYFASIDPGVLTLVDNELAVAAPGGMFISVDTGVAVVKGYLYVQYTKTNVAVTANASGNPRIDRVIVRVTLSGTDIGKAVIVVLAGTPAGSPAAPTLTQDATTWEISLAQVAVANGAASISTGNITDERDAAISYEVEDALALKAGLAAPVFTGAPTIADFTNMAHDHGDANDGGAIVAAALPTGIDAAKIGGGGVSSTEFDYLANVTSDIQTQLNDKVDNDGDTIAGALIVTGDTTFGNADTDTTIIQGHHRKKGAVGTASPDTALGSGGSVGVTIAGNDHTGEITITAGTSGLTSGTAANIGFATAKPDTNYTIQLTQHDTDASINAVQWRCNNASTSGWSISFAVAPTSGATYLFFYTVQEWSN